MGKFLSVRRIGRKPCQIESDTPNERRSLRRPGRFDSRTYESGANETINRLLDPRHERRFGLLRQDVSPVCFILRSLLDPSPQRFFFRRGQCMARFAWRHLIREIFGRDASPELTLREISRDDRSSARFQPLHAARSLVQS